MKKHLLILVICIFSIQVFYSQEDNGVVAFNLPLRNSLTFNRFAVNPTFSFVREHNKYIALSNKREWVQFDDAPLTYLASYSGRFGENIGAGISVFQQNYGVLTTFGGLLNFAYNARLDRDSNLTFGLNIGAYKSGLNTGKIVTNFNDPSIENVPDNLLITVNPGINYGSGFFDFGVSLKNIVAYNLESSMLIEDNPEQGIQGHIMYTGYLDARGFFGESKFTGLIKSEFRNEETIISGQVMLTVPKGLWAQAGYNTLYGASGGIGINISSQIAIEYNFEKALGDLTEFGPSHEVSLAYRFKNTNNYDYSSGDEVTGLISGNNKKRKKQKITKSQIDRKAIAEQKANDKAAADAKLLAEQQAKDKAAVDAKLLAEQLAKDKAAADAKLLAEQQDNDEAADDAKLLAEQQAKDKAAADARLLAEKQAKDKAAADARLLAEQQAKDKAAADARLLAEQQTNEKADIVLNTTDNIGIAMLNITEETEKLKTTQNELLQKFSDIVEIKNQDLQDLKEEYELSLKGIVAKPKPFKSITEENNILSGIKSDLEDVIKTRNEEIIALKKLYNDNSDNDFVKLDDVNLHYRKALQRLELEQKGAVLAKNQLDSRLKDINVATEIERKRRIKRAGYDNEEKRFSQDRITLQNIKQSNSPSTTPLTSNDFDFGEKQSDNIQILKNVNHVESGYYLVLAVHSDVKKRDAFLVKAIQSGLTEIDFFYDVTTSKYYIYQNKFDYIQAVNEALKAKGNKPYNNNMSLVKIEN